ncbi:MAG TPA: 5-formyltetrahydrofolate cyclo-ligase [Limnobacter sp.]|nr:5-formyltetrahydrofolate cyclo-ligase [Limnobacter sp.]
MKKTLRQTALDYRKQLAPEAIQAYSWRMCAHLTTLLQTFSTCTVGLFYPVRGEPDLLKIMDEAVLPHVNWALPVCSDSPLGPLLRFAAYRAGQALEAGRYDIPVPAIKKWVTPNILVIPCVAYHPAGSRLGYGAGWYDRTLAQLQPVPLCVGVAYSATCINQPFAEPHDHLLNYVVNEQGLIHCQSVDQ